MRATNVSLPPSAPVKRDAESFHFRFDDLVFDVQAYIIAFFIPTQDLLSLALVSRHLSSLATPALYSNVRLLFGLKPPSGSSRPEGAFTETLQSAQRAFTGQVLTRRAHARHARSLAWQLCGTSGCSSAHTFTEIFPLLENLERLHLVDAHPTHIRDRNITIPTLFPRVRDVTFTGITFLAFTMPILHSPHHLTSISLDTITPHSVALQLTRWISTADLSSLCTLSLRTVVQMSNRQPLNEHREQEIFEVWREALSAVRHTVKEVTLGFKEQNASVHGISLTRQLPPTRKAAQCVLPVFWEEEWSNLKVLKLEGIDIDGADVGQTAVRLRAAVPEVTVEPVVPSVRYVWEK